MPKIHLLYIVIGLFVSILYSLIFSHFNIPYVNLKDTQN